MPTPPELLRSAAPPAAATKAAPRSGWASAGVRRVALASLIVLPAVAGPIAPDGRGATYPDRSFDAERLVLTLDLRPDARQVAGTAVWTFRRLREGPVVLDQVALDIEAVRVDGAPVPYHLDGDTLVIDAPGDHPTVEIRYAATPENGLHWRAPGPDSPDRFAEVWSQGEGTDNRYWFPGYDHPNDRFVYEGHFTAPEGWKVLTNAPGTDLVNYLVMVAAGPYDVHGDDQISVWVPPGTPESHWRPALDPIPQMMKHLGERTGVPYPWGPYRQVFVQRFLYSGMENTTATVEAARLLAAPEDVATRPWNRSVFAHELAHQWYGDLLTCRDWRETWLNEGFATFFEGDWTASVDGPDAWARQVRSWYTASLGPGSLAGRHYLGSAGDASHNVYNKGASVLAMLRVLLGEDTFWAGIRSYTRGHQRQVVHSRDLQVAMEDVSGRSLDWFFQQWVELPHVPTLAARWSWADGDLTVTLTQKPSEEVPAYTLPVGLEIGGGPTPVTRMVWVDRAEVQVHLDVAERPAWVAVDPQGGLLVNLEVEQDPAAWTAQLTSPSPYARILAAEALGRTSVVEPLAARLADPALPLAQRLVAAKALGEQRSAAPLRAALRDPAPRVRLAAAEALVAAALPGDAPELARAHAAEASADVRSALLRALAASDPATATRLARTTLARTRDDGEYGTAAGVLGDHGALADLDRLLTHPLPRDRRLGGLRAAARIASRAPAGTARDEATARVARSAERLLEDLDLRTLQGALRVLADVGDARSSTPLEALRRRSEVASVRDLATQAITGIRGRGEAAPEAPNAEAARLRAIEERLGALEADAKRAEARH